MTNVETTEYRLTLALRMVSPLRTMPCKAGGFRG